MNVLVPFGAEGADRTAMAQMSFAIKCLYRDTRPELEAYLGAGGTVLAFVHQSNSWPPSWCAIRSGGGIYIVFSGTTNAWQWGLHVYGSFVRQSWANNEVHGQWMAVWEELKPEVVPLIGPEPERIRFAGHSYGGALAAIAALDVSNDLGAGRVEVMTFGAPRYMTQGYDRDRPLVWHEVSTAGDPVPTTPVDHLLIGSPFSWVGSRPLRWSPDKVVWDKARGRFWLNATGIDDYDQPPPDPLPPGVTVNPVLVHLLDQYYLRQRAYAQANPSPPALAAALVAYEGVRELGREQPLVDELPRIVPGPDAQPVVVPWYYGYDGVLLELGSPIMAAPVLLTGGEAWTVTLLINQGIQGYSESFTFYLTGLSSNGADPVAHMEGRGLAIANIRRKCLTSSARIVGIRVGQRRKGAPSVVNSGSASGAGPGLVTGTPAQESNCYYAHAYDPSGVVRATHYFRGWAQVDFLSDAFGNGKGDIFGDKYLAFRSALQTILRASHVANAVTSRGCIPTYDRGEGDAAPFTVISLGLSDTGRITATLNGDESGPFLPNTYAKLSIPATDCLRGVSGTWRVITSLVTAGNRVVHLDHKIRCSAEALVGRVGSIRREIAGFVAVDSLVTGGTGDKQCGPPFGATVGRRARR